MTEIPLGGGNVSGGVVRIGDTVRRPAGPWTPAVHALLGPDDRLRRAARLIRDFHDAVTGFARRQMPAGRR